VVVAAKSALPIHMAAATSALHHAALKCLRNATGLQLAGYQWAHLIIPLARAVAVLFVASVVPSSTEAVAMLVPDSWGIYGMYVLMICKHKIKQLGWPKELA